ncbi:hypothetical protein LSTR_LSTR008702 [Laodelphax striatellus]|uniref:GrpE protein homolog n=1 Tax=Laodelphax striatellus TaxID=195883 RepID=A0A482WHG9_LAOST|nr:hypothetical protein LSTR_LSTR008702 [Laodelphax striatellus]
MMGPISMCLRLGRLAVDNSSHYGVYSAIATNLRHASVLPTRIGVRHNTTASEEAKNTENENLSETEKELKSKLDNITEEFEKFKVQSQQTLDMWKRGVADAENARKRTEKQLVDTRQFAIQKFAKDILEVADCLSRAIDSVPKTEITDQNPHLKNLYEGLTLTDSELHRVFRTHGLAQINPIGELFDPNYHQALFDKEDEEKKPGTVIVVQKVGYKLNERVIRPALVGISKAKAT